MKISISLLALVGVAWASPAIFRRADECPACDYACIQSYPESCYCANEAELQCAKENPCHVAKVGECPPLEDNELASPAGEPVCDYVCTLQYPEGCYCQNENEQKCAAENPGYVPKIKPCPTEEPSKRSTKYKSCGTRGQAPCPSGTECRENPFASCGFACDQPGYCIPTPTEQCGGFAGFKCSNPKQVCVDQPNDGCDPKHGGADCIGYCFTPQK